MLSKALGHKNISTILQSYFPDIEDEDRNTVNPLKHMSRIINNTPTIVDTDNNEDIRSVNNSNNAEKNVSIYRRLNKPAQNTLSPFRIH